MIIRMLKAGAEITEGWIKDLVSLANRCKISVGTGLTMTEGPDGYAIDADFSEPIWIKTTAGISSGTYAFVEQFPDASGAWADGTMTDVAYESNGNTSVAIGTIAQAVWTSEGDWRFLAGTC